VSTSNLLPVEPQWLREPELDLERMGQRESLFALSNGHVDARGNLDEDEPYHKPGTLLSGFYEGMRRQSRRWPWESGHGGDETR
jgi:alpha,alpha-trehalose phosphorylase